MKSIEEFATEYAQNKYMPMQTYNAVMAGANYVLDAVRKCTSYEEFKKVISELEDYR